VNTYTLKNGLVLRLLKVSQDALVSLYADPDLAAMFRNPELLGQANASEMIKANLEAGELDTAWRANEGAVRLFNYCVWKGVENNPTPSEKAELRMMGFLPVDTAGLARVNWLRYIQMENSDEAASLVGAVMTYAFSDDESDELEEKDEIAALKAQVAALEAQKLTDGS